MRQVTLSKKEIKGLNDEIRTHYGIDYFFSKDDFLTLGDDTYIIKDGEVIFFYTEDVLIPSLKMIIKHNFLKNVIVNMGALRSVANGADVMRPGIVGVDAYVEEGNIVAIVDEDQLRPVAVGQSLFSKDEMERMEVGKMVINLHHVGDEVWNLTTGPG